MKKVLIILKKYFSIAFVLSCIVMLTTIKKMPSNIDLYSIAKDIFAILIVAIIFIPGIALIDLFVVKSAKALFKDFKESDRRGRIIIIVVFIILLLRKILIWTR